MCSHSGRLPSQRTTIVVPARRVTTIAGTVMIGHVAAVFVSGYGRLRSERSPFPGPVCLPQWSRDRRKSQQSRGSNTAARTGCWSGEQPGTSCVVIGSRCPRWVDGWLWRQRRITAGAAVHARWRCFCSCSGSCLFPLTRSDGMEVWPFREVRARRVVQLL